MYTKLPLVSELSNMLIQLCHMTQGHMWHTQTIDEKSHMTLSTSYIFYHKGCSNGCVCCSLSELLVFDVSI